MPELVKGSDLRSDANRIMGSSPIDGIFVSIYFYILLKKFYCEISIWVIHDVCTGICYRIP